MSGNSQIGAARLQFGKSQRFVEEAKFQSERPPVEIHDGGDLIDVENCPSELHCHMIRHDRHSWRGMKPLSFRILGTTGRCWLLAEWRSFRNARSATSTTQSGNEFIRRTGRMSVTKWP